MGERISETFREGENSVKSLVTLQRSVVNFQLCAFSYNIIFLRSIYDSNHSEFSILTCFFVF